MSTVPYLPIWTSPGFAEEIGDCKNCKDEEQVNDYKRELDAKEEPGYGK
jgi:hypothetical protein